MATKVADRGSLATMTSQTSTPVDMAAAGSITVGNWLRVRVACNNTGASGIHPNTGFTNTRSNPVYEIREHVQDPGAADAGIAISEYLSYVANAYTNGDDGTVTFGTAVTAKSIVIEEWTGLNPATPLVIVSELFSANEQSAETDTAGWIADTNVTLARVTTQAYVGSASIRATATAGADMEVGLGNEGATFVPASAGTTYQLGGWIKPGGTARTVRVEIDWFTSGEAYLSTTVGPNFVEASGSWIGMHAIGLAPATTGLMLAKIVVVGAAASEIHYLDAFSFGAILTYVGNAAGTAPALSPSPAAAGQTVICGVAIEGITGDTFTADSDTTNGSWDRSTRLATADATAANNAMTDGQTKVVTASGAQSWAATITSRDWAAIGYILREAVSATASPAVIARSFVTPAASPSAGSAVTPAVLAATAAVPAVTVSTVFSPTDYGGLTYWSDPGQESYANNDPAGQASDFSGNARHLTNTAGNRPTFKTAIFPTGTPAFDFDGTDDYFTTTTDTSVFITNSTYTILGVAVVDAVTANDADTYENMALWGENQGYAGLFAKTGATLRAYNWDTTDDNVGIAITPGVPFIFMERHDGGNLYLSIDGGAESSVASGNTGVVTGDFRLGKGTAASVFFDGKIGEFITYNQARSSGEIATLVSYLTTKHISAGGGATPTPAVIPAVVAVPAAAPSAGSTLTPSVIARSFVMPATVLVADATVTPAAIAATTTAPAASPSAGSTVAATVIAGSFTAPAATPGSSATATPSTLVAVSTLPAVTLSAGASVAAAVLPATAALPASTPSAAATQSATVFAATVATPAVSITAGATQTPATVAVAAALPATAAQAAATVTPAATAVAFALPAGTPQTAASVTPAVLAVVAALPAAAPQTDASTTVTPATIVLAGASLPIELPFTLGGSGVAMPAVTVLTGSAAIATPAVVAVAASLPVSAPSAASSTTPAVIARSFTAPQASPSAGSTVTPATVVTVASLPAVTVSAESSGTATPAVIATGLALPAASLSAGSTLTPSTIAQSFTLPAVSIDAGSSATTNPAVVAVVAALPAVSLIAGAAPTPATVAVTVALPAAIGSASAVAQAAMFGLAASLPAAAVSAISNTTAAPAVIQLFVAFPPAGLEAAATVLTETLAAYFLMPAVTPTSVVRGYVTVTDRSAGATLTDRVIYPAPALTDRSADGSLSDRSAGTDLTDRSAGLVLTHAGDER